ncbi:MAG: hypothetical protein MCS20_01930, partial [Candidatus Phytoplasma mali]|nr:hypothetical protein [Candidatus Phytoplasma australiense]MCG7202149.1 hypothetical protein [Candidatus Phytoplasma mali]MCZ8632733.1 hypothetical protein [Spiroplasma sp. Tabriz.8]
NTFGSLRGNKCSTNHNDITHYIFMAFQHTYIYIYIYIYLATSNITIGLPFFASFKSVGGFKQWWGGYYSIQGK